MSSATRRRPRSPSDATCRASCSRGYTSDPFYGGWRAEIAQTPVRRRPPRKLPKSSGVGRSQPTKAPTRVEGGPSMSRFLLTTWPLVGYIHPFVSVARALRERDHNVAFYTG